MSNSDKTLRIAIISDHADIGEKLDGGVQAVTRYILDGLRKSPGVEIHVLSIKYGIDRKQTISQPGYTLHLIPGSGFGALTAYRKDQKNVDSCLAEIKPQIVHGQGAGRDGITAVRSQYPSVITIHGIMSEEASHYSGFKNRLRLRMLNLLSERYCIKGGKHTIVISPYVSEYFGPRLAGKKYNIANPIADEFFDIRRDNESCRVLFAGRLMRLKGVGDLINATAIAAENQEIVLVLAGSLSETEYVDQLRSDVVKLGIENNVRFCGLLDEENLRKELGHCALLALPSYQETAPMVIAEAMAAGVPVVATDVGGVRYQVSDGENGFLVNPGDVPALAEKLGMLLGDSKLRDSFSKSAKASATEQYRASSVAARTVDVYRGILAEHGTGNN